MNRELQSKRRVIRWLLELQIKRIEAMAGIPHKFPEGSFKEAEDIDDLLDEAMKLGGAPRVALDEMARESDKIAKKIGYVEKQGRQVSTTSWADDVELEGLIGESSKKEELVSKGKGPQPPSIPGAAPLRYRNSKPILEEEDHEDPEFDEYPESFASQRETAQLRDDMEGIMSRLSSIEEKFALAMKEREILPMKIDSIRADINDQLTLILEKLQMAREENTEKTAVASAMTTIGEIKTDVLDQLQTASSYAGGEPKPTSPLVSQNAELRGKRRFKPVK